MTYYTSEYQRKRQLKQQRQYYQQVVVKRRLLKSIEKTELKLKLLKEKLCAIA